MMRSRRDPLAFAPLFAILGVGPNRGRARGNSQPRNHVHDSPARRTRPSSGGPVEDRPAAAEVPGLLGAEPGAAEVHQVEVDAVDIRPAEVGAAEVRLADLL